MSVSPNVRVVVNGEEREIASERSLRELIAELGLDLELVAVELNRDLVPRRDLAGTRLRDGDRVEIVEFVGGG